MIAEDGIVVLVNKQEKRFALDQSLDSLETLLDPEHFFRISRKIIIRFDAINKILPHLNSRLKISAEFLDDENSIVSRERVSELKLWLDK